jgi:hypothetical protein
MGYDTNLLKTDFNKDRIRAELDLSAMVSNTHERQEALAKATTYSKRFYVMGGKHM